MNWKAFYKNMLLLLAICMCGTSGQAQNLDSLEQVLKTAKLTPIEKMRIHKTLSWGYLGTEFEKTVDHARKGITIAEKENKLYTAGMLYCNIGESYYNITKYDTAIMYYEKALNIALQLKDEDIESRVYGSIGNVYNRKGNDQEALKYYLKALPIFEKNNWTKSIIPLYGNVAYIYYDMENYDQAGKYFTKAEIVARESKDTLGLGFILIGQSEVSVHQGDYGKALENAETAYRIYHSTGYRNNEIHALQEIAIIYNSGYKKYDTALVFIGKALIIAEETGFPNLISSSLNVQSDIYYQKGQYRDSEHTALKALEIDSTDLYNNSALYELIAMSNIMLGNKTKAIDYFKKYTRLSSTRTNKNYQSALTEMEIKYETEKKELKISALENEKYLLEKEKRLTLWLGITGGVVLLLTLAFFIVRQRLIQQKIARLEQEKQLVATQAVLDGETTERTRLARDLHDGLGSMLSVVKLNLNDMKNGVCIESEDVMRFDRVVGLLDESIRELRRVAHNMMPDSLTRYGLRVSLNDFCNSIPGAVFSYYGSEERLDPKLEVMIYRTVHELVNNVLKHASATEIIVQMIQEYDRISITVQDDGNGFDPAAPTSGTGLNNIRNRVVSYNGRMDIYSEPGKGTEISLEFKL